MSSTLRSTLTVLCVALASAALWSGPVYRLRVAHELGWSAQAVAGAFALGALATIPVALVAGLAADRWSPAAVVGAGGGLAGLALVAAALTTHWFQWYAAVVVLALGVKTISAGAGLTASVGARRGRALGTVFGALGLGLTLGPPLMQQLIDTMGWRWALAGEAALLLVLAAGVIGLSDVRAASRVPAAATPAASAPGPAHRRRMVGFFAGNVLIGVVDEGVYQHVYAHGQALGLGGTAAANVIGLVSVGYVAGSLGGGVLADRLGRRAVTTGAAGLCALSLLGIAGTSANLLWVWGVLFGGALGTTLVARSAAWADAFAGPTLGRDIGLVTPGFALGAATVTYGGAAWADAAGTFRPVWVAAAGAALGWAVLGGWLIRAPQRSSL